MGAAGRAIGPDGKLIKQDQKNGVKKGGVQQQRNQGGKGPQRPNQGNPRFGGAPMNKGPFEQRHGGPPGGPRGGPPGHGPRPLMSTPGMGPAFGPRFGHEAGGPRMGGPSGHGGPPLQMQAMRLFQGSAPDPTGSYGGFFGPKMNDGGSGSAPPAAALAPPRKDANPAAPMAMKQPTSMGNATAKSGDASGPPAHVGEVPGFGNNSSIHELFGKMVWRKMESLRDQQVIDELQNKIMNLIHDALAAQNAPQQTQGLNRGAFMQGPRHF